MLNKLSSRNSEGIIINTFFNKRYFSFIFSVDLILLLTRSVFLTILFILVSVPMIIFSYRSKNSEFVKKSINKVKMMLIKDDRKKEESFLKTLCQF